MKKLLSIILVAYEGPEIENETDREKVNSTLQSPYNAICIVESRFYGVNTGNLSEVVRNLGTGFLVGSDVLLTAGHVIYSDVTTEILDDNINNPVFADEIIIHPGAYFNGNILMRPYGSYTVDKCYLQRVYYQYQTEDFDWGLCVLDSTITNSIQPLNISVAESTLINRDVIVTGYPTDLGDGMYNSSGKINDITSYRLWYNAVTSDGVSGSPIFVGNSIVGIHVGYLRKDGNKSGVRINALIYDFVQSKKNQNGG